MTSDRFLRAKQIFVKVCARPEAQRAAFLEQVCADDAELRQEVESLLQYHEDRTGATSPDEDLSPTATAAPEQTAPHGTGNFILREKLGEGGMGEVWEAEQTEPVHRIVALKLIKPGMDSKQVIARFESERQALALMSHPNIARVFDAGTTEQGRPFFAMEFVPGESIVSYCDRHRLNTDERLELFVAVCHGIQHAHQKGIIHRDIKPSNVLVHIEDDRPVPKIIDFGVAKATQHRLTEKTMFTAMGVMIGTPEYMSPEQAEMTALDVDTRTDVYSLGVLLYQLLVGVVPYRVELREAGFDEIRRIIREDEPSKPSTRLSTLGDVSAETAKKRHSDPTSLRRELRGDLDWITMKALEKDRTRRYASPAELAADILRHRRHEPVLASPPHTTYRIGKFVRRHRVGVAAGTIVVAALLIGFAGTAIGLLRANREAETARQVSAFLTGLFRDLTPEAMQGNVTTPEEILGKSADKIEVDLAGQPIVQAQLMATMGAAYVSLGRYDEALPMFERSLAIRRERLGEQHLDTLVSLASLGDLMLQTGDYEKAQRLHEEVLTERRRQLGPEHVTVGWTLRSLGISHWKRSDFEAALPLFRQSLSIIETFQGLEHVDVASCLFYLGAVELETQDWDQALRHLERSLEIRETALGPEHIDVGRTIFVLALLHQRMGMYEAARPLHERSLAIQEKLLGPENPTLALPLNELAVVLTALGEYEAARTYLERALAIRESTLGERHPDVAWSLTAFAYLLRETGELEEARRYFERALSIQEEALGPDHFEVSRTLNFYAALERATGNRDEARRKLQRAIEIRRRVFGPDHHHLIGPLYRLACLAAIDGDRQEALRLLRDAERLGFNSRVVLDDPDLASLRGDPEFEAIISDIVGDLPEG